MKIRIETITPKIAKSYLKTQFKNRKIRNSHVTALANAMENNSFLSIGDTIRFNKAGELIDGQHRLAACIASNKSFEAIVVTDLEVRARDAIDTGIKRSPGDIFDIKGYPNATNLSSTLRWLWRFDNGFETGYPTNPQIHDLEDTLLKHPHVKDSLNTARATRFLITRSLACALHTLFAEKHQLKADEFFDKLGTGEGLFKGDPIYALRNNLLTNKNRKAKLPPHEVAAITIKAFNAYVRGRSFRTLKWTSKGNTKEPFPTIVA